MTKPANYSYKDTDRMCDLIRSDYRLLQVMSRFGLTLGVGDSTVDEVCRRVGVDTSTFLAVANFMQEEDEQVHDNVESLSLTSLLSYLDRAHSYFLDFSLPAIRRKLIEAIDCSVGNELPYLILKFFDGYAAEVREHMEFENRHEFAYVKSLMEGDLARAEAITHEACPMKAMTGKGADSDNVYKSGEHSHILLFTRRHALQHKQIDSKLSELKNIIIKYYPSSEGDNPLLNAVLFDIFICEEDLALHCRIEDCLFVPAVRMLEKKRGL